MVGEELRAPVDVGGLEGVEVCVVFVAGERGVGVYGREVVGAGDGVEVGLLVGVGEVTPVVLLLAAVSTAKLLLGHIVLPFSPSSQLLPSAVCWSAANELGEEKKEEAREEHCARTGLWNFGMGGGREAIWDLCGRNRCGVMMYVSDALFPARAP